MTYAFAGSMIGMLKVRRGDQLAGPGVLYIAQNLAAILSFRLPAGQDWRGCWSPAGRSRQHRSSP
jgi:hypothetical protein